MAKHLLFQNNRLHAMANEDAKSDFIVSMSTTVTAKTVSDEDYKNVGVKNKRATLDGDTIVYTDKGPAAADITDATEAQNRLATVINELIINRSGGDATVAEASEINNDAVYLIDNTIFYSGHYIQILSIDQNRNFQDQTNQFIENNFNNDTGDFCDPNTAWFRWLRLDDYDNDGNIDLWNELIDYQVLQRWEWNGSMFIKIENQ